MNATFLIGAAEGVQWGDFLFYLLTDRKSTRLNSSH